MQLEENNLIQGDNVMCSLFRAIQKERLAALKRRLKRKTEINELKFQAQQSSHSLLWVWEFTKKAVLICFLFYFITQIYAMSVMVIYCDFSCLGEFISQNGTILRECVFGYFIKSGAENVMKIWFQHKPSNDEPVG